MSRKKVSWDQLQNELLDIAQSDPKTINFTNLNRSISDFKRQINSEKLVSVNNPNFAVNKCYYGDSMELAKTVPNDFVDLVVTSPPYANTVSYGDSVTIYDGDTYGDWFIPLANEICRFLKPSGSFILNINDKISDKERETYVFELVTRITKETGLQLFDRYIWYKKTTLPTGGDKRLNDRVEYVFHFVKDKDAYVAYTDNIRVPYKESSLRRYQTPVNSNDIVDENGVTKNNQKMIVVNPLGTKPCGVFRFDTRSAMKGGKHPAPFHPQLPEWFIQWLTKPQDVVLDPFMGCGTTAHASLVMDRNWIGFEINGTYKEWIDDIQTSYPNYIKPYIENVRVND